MSGSKSELEEALAWQINVSGLPLPLRQYPAIPKRRWRWDLAWPDHMLLAEVQGGIWASHWGGKSGHTTGQGITRDCLKANAATLAGWRQLFFTGEMIESGEALHIIEEALAND